MLSRALVTAFACCLLGACVVPRTQDAVDRPQQPRLEEDRVLMSDGATLPLTRWGMPDASTGDGTSSAREGPRAIIVAVHGLNDHAGSFAGVAEYLAARGFATYAFDQRGFGTTEQRGIWAGEDVMADDLWQVARLIRERHPGVPVYALGESMGDALVLHALARHDSGWIDAAIVMAPAVWNRDDMPWYARGALQLLAHTWRGLKLSGKSVDRSPTNDDEALRRLHEDPLVIHKTRVDALWGIANLMDTVTTEPVPFDVPVLILYGGRDEIVPPNAVCSWLASLDPSRPWQYAFYPEGWHLLTRDLNAAVVREDIAAWFASPGTALAHDVDKHGASFPPCAESAR